MNMTSHKRNGGCSISRMFSWQQKKTAKLHFSHHLWGQSINYTWALTHGGRDKMDAISQTIFSSAFYWMKMYKLRLKIYWSLFLRVQLTIFQHWFRWWLGAVQATSYYRNQCWLVYWCISASLCLNELTRKAFSDHKVNMLSKWYILVEMGCSSLIWLTALILFSWADVGQWGSSNPISFQVPYSTGTQCIIFHDTLSKYPMVHLTRNNEDIGA